MKTNITRISLAAVFTLFWSSSAAESQSRKKPPKCSIKLNISPLRVGVDSIDFEWTDPQSCVKDGGATESYNLRYGPCLSANKFNFSAAKKLDLDESAPGPGPNVITLTELLPGTRYCLGLMLRDETDNKFGPFVGSTATNPDTAAVLRSSLRINGKPEFTFQFHVIDLHLDVSSVSTASPPVQQYLALVSSRFTARLLSNIYSVLPCGYPFDPPAKVTMAFDPEVIKTAGFEESQLYILESTPTDDVAIKLNNQRLDSGNHTITADVDVINYAIHRTTDFGARSLDSNFAIFGSTVSK